MNPCFETESCHTAIQITVGNFSGKHCVGAGNQQIDARIPSARILAEVSALPTKNVPVPEPDRLPYPHQLAAHDRN